ncbi:MAG: signal recognition particle-docking protein FtsY, partial [Candidatus Marinimicrobia bacterium]|nr:signal recognition particle-docking protein FtsY [Candidatus Neomarinimicrobiota bacterium]
RSGVEFIGNPQGKDPAAIAYDAARAAQARNFDVLLIDTAGRLHTKSNLMEELAKVKRVITKVIPSAPHEVWLVLDATVGQNGILQAREFQKAIGVTGLILTKLDGTAKGGIALAIHHELNIPIRFLGIGEKLTDLVEFEPQEYIRSLLEIE